MHPADPVTPHEAARILGCSTSTVRRRVKTGALPGSDRPLRLSRSAMEQLAMQSYPWEEHVDDRFAYWVLDEEAATILGITVVRLSALAESRRVPFIRHRDGTRLYRRAQLERAAATKRKRRPARPLVRASHHPPRGEVKR